jgi:transposase
MQRLPKGLYSPEFRDEVVRLHLEDNLTITKISSRLSMPKGTLKIGWWQPARVSWVKSVKTGSRQVTWSLNWRR